MQAVLSVKSAACPYLKDVNMHTLDTIQDRDGTCIIKLYYYGLLSTFCRGLVWLVLNSVQPYCVEGILTKANFVLKLKQSILGHRYKYLRVYPTSSFHTKLAVIILQ